MEDLNSPRYFLWNNTLGIAVSAEKADEQVPVASLTKMMTALLVLERRNLDEVVVIVPEMLQHLDEFVVVGLSVGQEVTVEDLLYATLLPSAGDAAQALAISTAGSIEGFADLMNARAEELGMVRTHFSNPVGFDEDNYSTMREMAMLLREALKNEKFAEIIGTFEKELPSMGKVVKKTFEPVKYVRGGKTGFTNNAGRCLASVAKVEGTEYILVTAGAELGQNIEDAVRVYSKVEEKYEPMRLVKEGEWLVRIPVEGSKVKTLELRAEEDLVVALEKGVEQSELRYIYDGAREITREMEAGEELGKWEVYAGEQKVLSQTLYYQERLEFYDYGWLVMGWGVNLAVLIAVIIFGWKWRERVKKGSEVKTWMKVLTIGMIGLWILNAAVNGLWTWNWLENEAELQVNQPELTVDEEWKQQTDNAEGNAQDGGHNGLGEPETPNQDQPTTGLGNCTTGWENLMLINPNFTVEQDFITARRQGLISLSQNYGIAEYNYAGNGDNLMIPEAAAHLGEMVTAYKAYNPGHEMGTYSCFRARGTLCGRLCAATGASDHHTGLTCDLIDLAYGADLNTDDYANHKE